MDPYPSLIPAWAQWVLCYYVSRYVTHRPARAGDDRGEVSATTVVLAAALIALAIAVGVIITTRVQDKANTINLG